MSKLLVLTKFDHPAQPEFLLKQWQYAIKNDLKTECILCNLTVSDKGWMIHNNIGKISVPAEPTLSDITSEIKNNFTDVDQILLVDSTAWLIENLSELIANTVDNFKLSNYTAEKSPVTLINDFDLTDFVDFPPKVVCSLSNTFGSSGSISATLKSVYSRVRNVDQTTLVSVDNIGRQFDDVLFDRDNERLQLTDGKIIFWSDFYTLGLKTRLQKKIHEVTVYG